jgi:hypothetical protein
MIKAAIDAVSTTGLLVWHLLTTTQIVAQIVAAMTRTPPQSSHEEDTRKQSKSLNIDDPMSRVRTSQNDDARSSKQATSGKRSVPNETKNMQQKHNSDADKEEDFDTTVANVEKIMHKRNLELQFKCAEYDSLQVVHNKLRTDFESQAKVLEKSESTADWMSRQVDDILTKTLEPYARANDLVLTKWTDRTILEVQDAMFEEATAAQALKEKNLALQTEAKQVILLKDQNRILQTEAKQVSFLRDQVHVLQNEMLAKVEKVRGVSDEQFAGDFRNIVSLVKSLSRSLRPYEDKDLAPILGSSLLLDNVASHHWSGRVQRKYCIEAWSWSILLAKVFWTPFTYFGKEGTIFSEMYTMMFGAAFYHAMPIPALLCETWRRATTEHMMEFVDRAVITSWNANEEKRLLECNIIDTRNEAFAIIESTFALFAPAVDLAPVRQILDKAFALAMQMSVQRSRLQITYPTIGDRFNKEQMSAMPDLDGEDIEDGIVAFIVHPGLTKWGDVHGKNLELRYDIVPALVQLEPLPQEVVQEKQSEPQAYADVLKHGNGGVQLSEADRGGVSQR